MPHIPRAIHEPCDIEMVTDKVGVKVEMLDGQNKPYYKIVGDRLKCPRCNTTIIWGLGKVPLVEHFESDYDTYEVDITGVFA
jgi:hypothetical protein